MQGVAQALLFWQQAALAANNAIASGEERASGTSNTHCPEREYGVISHENRVKNAIVAELKTGHKMCPARIREIR
ncbi:hypothetical protein MRY16398_12360 [Phytobacter sp. MRY16-398]|nr:hypothetical protein MRY16398_12360 [Phytobacter sp. MRY16-398]